jgi:hypothetical protein
MKEYIGVYKSHLEKGVKKVDKEKLEHLFNELLEKYKQSETCVIENMSSEIEEEKVTLNKEIEDYKVKFKSLL